MSNHEMAIFLSLPCPALLYGRFLKTALLPSGGFTAKYLNQPFGDVLRA